MRRLLLWVRRRACFHGDLVQSPDHWTAGYLICGDCGSTFSEDGTYRGHYAENPRLRNAKIMAGIDPRT